MFDSFIVVFECKEGKKLGYVLPALVFLWVYPQTFSFGYLTDNAFIWDFVFVAVLYVEYVAVSFFLTNEIKRTVSVR